MAMAGRELQPSGPRHKIQSHTQGYGPRVRVPRRKTLDGRTREHLALQEIIQPAPAEEFRKDMLEGACCVVKEVAP
jgi:hypothetical protein